jgi:hypothetical protein
MRVVGSIPVLRGHLNHLSKDEGDCQQFVTYAVTCIARRRRSKRIEFLQQMVLSDDR